MRGLARTYCGILLLVLIGCASLFEQLSITIRNVRPLGTDEVSIFERRFSQVKKDLPSFGKIGYLTNRGEGAFKEYAQTVYTLSPVMPVLEQNCEVIIANLSGDPQSWKMKHQAPVEMLKNYGNGIVIFRHIH